MQGQFGTLHLWLNHSRLAADASAIEMSCSPELPDNAYSTQQLSFESDWRPTLKSASIRQRESVLDQRCRQGS